MKKIKGYSQFILENKNHDRLASIIHKFPQAKAEELQELFTSISETEQEAILNQLEGLTPANVEDRVESLTESVLNEEVNPKLILASIALLLGTSFASQGQITANNLPPQNKIETSINQQLEKLPSSGTTVTYGDWVPGTKTHTTQVKKGSESDTLVVNWKQNFQKTDTIKTVTVEYNEDFVMSPPKGAVGTDSYELAQTVNNIHDAIQNLKDGKKIDWASLQTTSPGDSLITWSGKGDNHLVVKMFLKKTFSDTDNIAVGDIYGYTKGQTFEVDAQGNPIGLEIVAHKGDKVAPGTVGYFVLGQWNVETNTNIEIHTETKTQEWSTVHVKEKSTASATKTSGSGTQARPYKGKCPSQ